MLRQVDEDHSGDIGFEEFLTLVRDQLAMISSEATSFDSMTDQELLETAKEVFLEFDDDGSGQISLDELSNVFKNLGQSPSTEDLERLVELVDKDQSGEIDLQEFV
jgi:Ca2+-binding EF-hand superfamily protein